MKISNQNFKELLRYIAQKQCKSLLLYGHNYGLMTNIIKQIAIRENLLITEFDLKELNISELIVLANRTNFFQQRELIKLTNVTATISAPLQKFISEQDYFNLICFVSEENLPPKGLRKIYEAHPQLVAMACYQVSENNITAIIRQYAQKYGKILDKESVDYLKQQLKGDNQLIKSELEKLFTFHHDQEKISQISLENILSSDLSANPDLMCIYFTQEKPSEFLEEIEKLLQNQHEVLVLRILAKYLFNLYLVKKQIIAGQPIELAMKNIHPPIFFKYVEIFKQTVRSYSLDKLVRIISHIQKSEAEFKKNSANFSFFQLYTQCHSEIKT